MMHGAYAEPAHQVLRTLTFLLAQVCTRRRPGHDCKSWGEAVQPDLVCTYITKGTLTDIAGPYISHRELLCTNLNTAEKGHF